MKKWGSIVTTFYVLVVVCLIVPGTSLLSFPNQTFKSVFSLYVPDGRAGEAILRFGTGVLETTLSLMMARA